MLKLAFLMGSIVLLAGCAPRTTIVQPGYHQQGAYAPTAYQPGYYDVYGNYHVPQDMESIYLEPRYQRPMYGTAPPMYGPPEREAGSFDWLTKPVIYGMLGGLAVVHFATDGGLLPLLGGALIGGYGGYMYEQRSMSNQY